MLYTVLKSLHIISDIVWIGGMLINAFVIAMGPPTIRTGVITALRPYDRRVTTAGLAGAWIFGLILAFGYVGFSGGWLHLKLLIVVMLSALHGMLSAWLPAGLRARRNADRTRFGRRRRAAGRRQAVLGFDH